MSRRGLEDVAAWQKTSLIDFPGLISTVLFFKGCNLRCPYCHNPSLVKGIQLEPFDQDDCWAALEKNVGKIEGVVITGGEPTLSSSLPVLVDSLKALGYQIKLDTNGLRPDQISELPMDYLALDIKTTPEFYASKLGAFYEDVSVRLKQSLRILQKMGKRGEVRITLVPNVIDVDSIEMIGQLIHGVQRVFLQPLQQRVPLLDERFESIPLFTEEQINGFRNQLLNHVEQCTIRGVG